MGAWGTAIFSDDMAADIRHEYNALISIGKDNEDAETLLLEYYKDILGRNDPDEDIFWFSLALSEWKKGRLTDRTKKKALEALRSGRDLERWKFSGNEKNYQKRMQVLNEFEKTLLSPMPEVKKLRKPTVHHCPWELGSLLAYRIVTSKELVDDPCFGKYALLRVIKINRHPVSKLAPTEYYDESMLVGVYGWIGDEIPNPDIVENLKFIPFTDEIPQSVRQVDLSILNQVSEIEKRVIMEKLKTVFSRRVETCASLDWHPVKGEKGDITYLGCDESFKTKLPDFFNTSITAYSLTHFKPFDCTLAKRLKSFL